MSIRTCNFLIPLALLATAPGAWADESDDGDEVTITIMEDAESLMPDSVTRVIELPPPAQGQANGHDEANAARNKDGRKAGLERAEMAREQGREAAEHASENARGNREDHGRPENPGRPDDLPQPPGR